MRVPQAHNKMTLRMGVTEILLRSNDTKCQFMLRNFGKLLSHHWKMTHGKRADSSKTSNSMSMSHQVDIARQKKGRFGIYKALCFQ